MKTTLSIALAVLVSSISVAQATPIRGTFTGVVTYNSNPTLDLPFLEGTPAWGLFGYDTNYLSSPDEFGNRYVLPSPQEVYDGFFVGIIGDKGAGFTTGYYGSGSLLIGPNGLPVSGNAAGPYDSFVFSNGFALATIDFSTYVVAEGTYRLPDHESTLAVTVVGLMALAAARRFLSRVSLS